MFSTFPWSFGFRVFSVCDIVGYTKSYTKSYKKGDTYGYTFGDGKMRNSLKKVRRETPSVTSVVTRSVANLETHLVT